MRWPGSTSTSGPGRPAYEVEQEEQRHGQAGTQGNPQAHPHGDRQERRQDRHGVPEGQVAVAGPGVADAGQQIRVAISLCDRLEMPDALRASRRLLKRADDLGLVIREELTKARQRRTAELQRLVTGTTKPVMPVMLATLSETDPWLSVDVSPGDAAALPGRAAAMLQEAVAAGPQGGHATAWSDRPIRSVAHYGPHSGRADRP